MKVCQSAKVREDAFTYYPRLARLAKFCEEHYREDICLQQAADVVNLERTYFCTYFHKKVGVCFNCWIALVRVEHAKEHLKTGEYSISIIASKVGFKSLSTFERTFKRCTDMSASQFRKNVRPC